MIEENELVESERLQQLSRIENGLLAAEAHFRADGKTAYAIVALGLWRVMNVEPNDDFMRARFDVPDSIRYLDEHFDMWESLLDVPAVVEMLRLCGCDDLSDAEIDPTPADR